MKFSLRAKETASFSKCKFAVVMVISTYINFEESRKVWCFLFIWRSIRKIPIPRYLSRFFVSFFLSFYSRLFSSFTKRLNTEWKKASDIMINKNSLFIPHRRTLWFSKEVSFLRIPFNRNIKQKNTLEINIYVSILRLGNL